MSEIRAWLAARGLEPLADLFELEQIDVDALNVLTDANLKDLGLPLGPRAKVLAAIQHWRTSSTSQSEAATASRADPAPPPPTSLRQSDAERRQLTILFCDLVGSTQLSQQMDPEGLRELMHEYQSCCRAVIEKYDGHIAQYLGDGLMVYFGFPRAHEDDAERAARSALEMMHAVARITVPVAAVAQASNLAVRIGIATGSVVVGETGGGDASVPKVAVGETPNLASRLQSLAGPSQIVIGPSTRRLLGESFEFADLGEQTLKGIVEPVRAFRVLGALATEGRFEAIRGRQVTPMIGRESEIGLLMNRWQQTRAGEGQAVLLCGEAGIGKSRITRAVRESVGEGTTQRLRFQCSPYHTSAALYPVIDHLERVAGFTPDDSVEHKLDKLEALWSETGPARAESLALISLLLALPSQRYPALAFAPHKQKEKTLAALVGQVKRVAHQGAVLIVFEDAHWIDSTTQEWLDLLVTRLHAVRAMLLVTHRPEYAMRWGAQAHVTALTLNRLGKRQGAALIESTTQGRALPTAVVDQILAKTDGVPLFVEELTKAVLESDLLAEGPQGYVLTRPLTDFAIPSTLHDSLMARLDRMAAVKELAQIAACIGREFAPELLGAVASIVPAQLETGLAQLTEAQLIFRITTTSGTAYIFKHALVQDAAYESLLKSKRQHYHTRIAQAFAQEFPEVADQGPDVVARHFVQASMHGEALLWWRKASALALRRNAPVEAIEHCNAALEVLVMLPENVARDRMELSIQNELGSAVLSLMGWADPRAGKAFERAVALSRDEGYSPELMQALYGLAAYYMVRGDQGKAVELTREFLQVTRDVDDLDARIAAHFLHGIVQQTRGVFHEAMEHLTLALKLIGPGYRESQLLRFGQDFKASALKWLTRTTWHLGYHERSMTYMQQSEGYARERDHPYCWGWAYGNMARQAASTMEDIDVFEKGLAHSREYGYQLWVGYITALQGAWLIWKARPREALARMEEGEAILRSLGIDLWRSWIYVHKASALHALGDSARGLSAIVRALQYAQQCDEWDSVSEIHRVKGELHLIESPPNFAAAEAAFEECLKVAREQGAKIYALRGAASYARHLHAHGRSARARTLLQTAYEGFTEGFDSKELREAKALLATLND